MYAPYPLSSQHIAENRYQEVLGSLCRKRSKIDSLGTQSWCPLSASLGNNYICAYILIVTTLPHKFDAIAQGYLAYRMSPGQCNRGHVQSVWMHTKLKVSYFSLDTDGRKKGDCERLLLVIKMCSVLFDLTQGPDSRFEAL